MPGSTTVFRAASQDGSINSQKDGVMSARQPPPVAPRHTRVTIQTWQQAAPSGDNENSYHHKYGSGENHVRTSSMDSLESSGSSSSGSGGVSSVGVHNYKSTDSISSEFIPTRTVGKTPKLPSNPLQFVKVQSPLYKKAEQQIKLTKEVKITREALKEGEEEWQSNLDNWKSRRRKVSEKVIQRAEEMRQIEAEEQQRQEQILQQQRKIKKFSEIVENKTSKRNYNLDLYIGQGDDSGLGGTPEPDDHDGPLDSHNSTLRSDTSEGMTSEAESVDSDIQKSEKVSEKEPPKVPKKPQPWATKKEPMAAFNTPRTTSPNEIIHHRFSSNELSTSDNLSSTEPSDIEGHAGDSEAVSSEDDGAYCGQTGNIDSGLESLCEGSRRGDIADTASDFSQDSCPGLEKTKNDIDSYLSGDDKIEVELSTRSINKEPEIQENDETKHVYKISIKPGDNRGFGFTIKGGKDQSSPVSVETLTKGGPADICGLKVGDKILSLNGESTSGYSHASLVFSIKQAVYTGFLDIAVSRLSHSVADLVSPPIPERPKPTSRKCASFAEKLALFSSGVSNTQQSKSSTMSSKTEELKQKSLVLRRRSAFENGQTNNESINRRSSCVSQGTSNVTNKDSEKRHSADLSSYVLQENGFSKKGRPPPVPQKPKLKSKFLHNEHSVNETSKVNGITQEMSNSVSESFVSKAFIEPSDTYSHPSNTINEMHNSIQEPINDENKFIRSLDNLTLKERTIFQNEKSLQNENQQTSSYINFNEKCSKPILDINKKLSPIYTRTMSFDMEFNESILDDQDQSLSNCKNKTIVSNNVVDSNVLYDESANVIAPPETYNSVSEESNSCANANEILTDIDNSKELNETLSECVDSMPVYTSSSKIKLHRNLFSESIEIDEPDDTFVVETDLKLQSSAYTTSENSTEVTKDLECVENSENGNNSQANLSPLSLPLEKIEEDDVVSASTTTSSETPDTETVIESLPTNLSPLPNDESNGENSSALNSQDTEQNRQIICNDNNKEISSTEIENLSEPALLICNEKPPGFDHINGIDMNISNQTFCPPNYYDVTQNETIENHVIEQTDEEYSREYEESLDKLTSLDVIDEIEQRLMQELEQQGNSSFQDINEDLNGHLTEANKEWFYLEEEELLDDLTPRKLEPPREPPPPPPPPEEENIMPLARVNSTKRIKKELWRRRSDFLGLDSQEGIDVDNIPPPPPGLDEILKQEREQTQWLEKRISLVEPEYSYSLEVSETLSTVSTDSYSHSDYNSGYFYEENNGVANEDTLETSWKENSEPTSFVSTYEANFENISETPIVENNSKPESPQHKAKQNIHNLGAAPKAKIMDSNKWITEKTAPVTRKSIDPVFRHGNYNQNYWLAQDGERKRTLQRMDTPAPTPAERRYSMPPIYTSNQPDVTVRTWGDRGSNFQPRPKSEFWNGTATGRDLRSPYNPTEKQEVLRTRSLENRRGIYPENEGTLESEVHRCSCCGKGLCEGSAMGIEALQLYFHIECFRCCKCQIQLGNGSCGTDVQVKNNQLFCPRCFTID